MLKKSQINQPYNNKLKFLQILLIPLMLLGFEAISFLVSDTGLESNKISIIYRVFFVLLCLLVIINHSIKKKIFSQNYILFIFWTLYLIRGFYDSTLNPESIKSMTLMFWLFAFFLSFIPMIALFASINFATIIYAKKVFLILAITVNVLSLVNNFTAISEGSLSRYMSNIIVNSVTYGQAGLALVIISFSYFISSLKTTKYIYLLFMLLGLVNLALAGSRGPVIELIFLIIFFIASNKNKFKFKYLIFLPLIFYGFFNKYDDFIKISNVLGRIESTNLEEERVNIFLESWQRFTNNPIFGSRAIGEWAHNIFLGSLEALGIIGLILMIVIYRNAIKRAFVLAKFESTDWLALLLVMQLVAALISGAIWNSITLWALIGLISNLYYNRELYNDIKS
tara:strand:- start:309 stop:1496 length:1188 start_codon:yes stop_codon:yes gene_type:complete